MEGTQKYARNHTQSDKMDKYALKRQNMMKYAHNLSQEDVVEKIEVQITDKLVCFVTTCDFAVK